MTAPQPAYSPSRDEARSFAGSYRCPECGGTVSVTGHVSVRHELACPVGARVRELALKHAGTEAAA